MARYMKPELYKAATTGNIKAFQQAIGDTEHFLYEQVSPRGNSVLHLAARSGHEPIVTFILKKSPDLVKHKNLNSDLALHVAASAGNVPIINSLIPFAKSTTSGESREREGSNLFREVNKQGKTALHVAVENHHREVALLLIKADPEVSFSLDMEGMPPIHVAAKAGYLDLVKCMTTECPKRTEHSDRKQKGKPVNPVIDRPYDFLPIEPALREPAQKAKASQLLHASIIGRNRDVIDIIWNNDSTLINSTDEEGRTPLCLAASIGYLDGVRYILDKSTDATYHSDQNGFFPIHWACRNGHLEVIKDFLRRCPDSVELLNNEGENILHVAAKSGRVKVVSWMLKSRELEMLINERDENGYTPLHWATINCHPKVVSILTWHRRVKLEIVDKYGNTAFDLAETRGSTGPFRSRLTLLALKSANAPQSEKAKKMAELRNTGPERDISGDQYKDRVNTLLLVATLAATVTFAAGFTLPGGNNDSNPGVGMATLVTKIAFQVFLICNTIAMYSSIIVAVTLIWAQLGDPYLVLHALRFALPLLGVALAMMSTAFMAGVYLVVANHHWLAYLVLVMGPIFLAGLLVLFLPLCFPLSSTHRVVRYMLYYPFQLMILASKSDIDKGLYVHHQSDVYSVAAR